MRTLPAIALAGIAAALAGTAIAASAKTHVMNVPLPDGSVARVEYVGDVAPRVTIAPAPFESAWLPGAIPSFAGFDRMIEQMNRQTQDMMRQVQQIQTHPGQAGLNVAGYGNLPAGADSVSVVSVSNGRGTCTRTTQMVSQGAGKPPKVTSNVSGDCGSGTGAPSTPAQGSAPINPT
jgi:hypothetical protein